MPHVLLGPGYPRPRGASPYYQGLLLPVRAELLQVAVEVVPLEVAQGEDGVLQRTVQRRRVLSLQGIVHVLQSSLH